MTNLLMPYVNNKETDQSGHQHSLICVFVFCSRDIYDIYRCYIENFKTLASFCSWAARFAPYLMANLQRQVFLWCGYNKVQYEWDSQISINIKHVSHDLKSRFWIYLCMMIWHCQMKKDL